MVDGARDVAWRTVSRRRHDDVLQRSAPHEHRGRFGDRCVATRTRAYRRSTALWRADESARRVVDRARHGRRVSIAVIGPGGTAPHRVLGDLLAAGALFSFSAYWLVSKHAREATNAIEYTAGVMIFAALLTTPVVFIAGQSLTRIHAGDWTLDRAARRLCPGQGHLVMNWAHRYVDASISAAISCLSPLVASVAAIPILESVPDLAPGHRGSNWTRGDRRRRGTPSGAGSTPGGVASTRRCDAVSRSP